MPDSEKKVVFAQTPKGKELLVYKGFKYELVHTGRDGEKRWRCNFMNKYGCRAGARTVGDNFDPIKSHNHPRENVQIQVMKQIVKNNKK